MSHTFVIAIPSSADPIVHLAAEELAGYVAQICGESPVLSLGPSAHARYTFYLGNVVANGAAQRYGAVAEVAQAQARALGGEGFLLRNLPEATLIVGGSSVGVLYGVYSLLERELGVRWFYPDPRDEIVSRLPTAEVLRLLAAPLERQERPAFALRMMTLGSFSLDQAGSPIEPDALISWAGRQRLNALQLGWNDADEVTMQSLSPSLRRRGIRLVVGDHHTYLKFLPPQKYLAEHPDWFALVNGERRAPDRWWGAQQFCTTNPAARETYCANIIDFLRKNPGVDAIYMWPNDYGAWCACPTCSQRSVADNLLDLDNATARAIREAGLSVEVIHPAYGNHVAPPERERPQGVSLSFCGWGRDFRYPWNDPHTNPEHRAFLQRWLEIGRESGVPVYLHSKLMRLRGIGYHLLPLAVAAQDMRHYHEIGLAGLDFHIAHVGWWTKGLNTYFVSKLAWNPQESEEEVLEDYFQHYWGASQGVVRDFYQQVERIFFHRQYYRPKQNFNLAHAKLEEADPTFFNPQEAGVPPELGDYNARVLRLLQAADATLASAERQARSLQTRMRLAKLRFSFDFVWGEQESIKWLVQLVARLAQADALPAGPARNVALNEAEAALAEIARIEAHLAEMIAQDAAQKSGLIWDPTHHLGRLGVWREALAQRRREGRDVQ